MQIDRFSLNSNSIKLFLASFLSLYFELLFIRWIPDGVHVLSFFGNFVLLACFLGLSVGLSMQARDTDEEKILREFYCLFTIAAILLVTFTYFRIGVPPPNEGISLNDDSIRRNTLNINIYATIFVFFTLTALLFIPLGRLISIYLEKHKPLQGYTINIFASLVGITVFSVLAYFCTRPFLWIAIGLLLFMPFYRKKIVPVILLIVLSGGIFFFEKVEEARFGYKKYWSPYYNLRVVEERGGKDYQVFIGNSILLYAKDLSPISDAPSSQKDMYNFPFSFCNPEPQVLVLGAGMGNDVAAALRNGAQAVDSVEIDPMIIQLGKKLHPEKPFSHPGVTIYNDDARSFLNKNKKKYDLIIFGTIDSHGLFSQMSSIKMESYIYTRECFEKARDHLTDNGIMYVKMGPFGPFVTIRVFRTIQNAFLHDPLFFIFKDQFTMDKIYIASHKSLPERREGLPENARVFHVDDDYVESRMPYASIVSTDDWPHIFLKEKKIPLEYMVSLALLICISIVLLYMKLPRPTRFNLHFFLLGAGFMLIETRGITELGLLFGATWIVNSIVIGSILVMIFFANLLLIKMDTKIRLEYVYILLLLTLAGLYFLKFIHCETGSLVINQILSVLFISLPVFFAAIIFGTSFKETSSASLMLASNMLGSMFGGALEYTSMVFGLRSLYLLAFIIYLLSYLCMRFLPRK